MLGTSTVTMCNRHWVTGTEVDRVHLGAGCDMQARIMSNICTLGAPELAVYCNA